MNKNYIMINPHFLTDDRSKSFTLTNNEFDINSSLKFFWNQLSNTFNVQEDEIIDGFPIELLDNKNKQLRSFNIKQETIGPYKYFSYKEELPSTHEFRGGAKVTSKPNIPTHNYPSKSSHNPRKYKVRPLAEDYLNFDYFTDSLNSQNNYLVNLNIEQNTELLLPQQITKKYLITYKPISNSILL